jgi:hypothetical protein
LTGGTLTCCGCTETALLLFDSYKDGSFTFTSSAAAALGFLLLK